MKNRLQFVTSPLGAALATIVFTFSSAQAGTTWDAGGANTNINTAGNWDGDTLPTSLTDGTQILTFGTGGTAAAINTTVNVSGLVFDRDGAFSVSAGAGTLTIGTGGITNNASAITGSRTYTISEGVILNGNQTWSVNNKDGSILGGLVVSGPVSGSSAITKTGNGTLTLSSSGSTYSGGTIINAGRVDISQATSFGTGNVTIATGAYTGIALTGNGTITNNFNISGNGTANGAIQGLTANGTATLSGLVTLSGDAMIGSRRGAGNSSLRLSGGITSGGVNRILTLNVSGNASAINQLTIDTNSANLGSGGTLDIGTGLVAGGLGTYNLNVGGNTWGTTILRGVSSTGVSSNVTLNLGAANALGSSSSILQLGASSAALEVITVNLNGNSQTIGGLRTFGSGGAASANGTRTITSATAATLTIDNSSGTSYLYDGVIDGDISLIKSGSATQTLTRNNTYTGATTVNAGVLNIRANDALGTTAGATSVASGASLQVQDNITVSDVLSITGAGSGGTGALRSTSGNNNWAGNITISGSTVTRIQSDAGSLLTISGNINGGAGNTTVFQGNGNHTVSGTISGGQAVTLASTAAASSVLTLSGNNTYTGGTNVNGANLLVTSTGSLASGSALTIAASATANLANAGQTLGAVSNANTASNALNFSATDGTVTLASLSGAGNTRFGSNAVVTGGISTGTINAVGSLTANITGGTVGAGSLTAGSVSGGTNNITGAAGISTLSGGTTTVGGVATIGTMSSGTANLNGATSSIATLSGGSIALGSSTVLSVSGGTSSGVISGGGGLNKTGAGALELLGAKTYTGNTTVSEGTLTVNGSLAGGVTVNLGATLGGNATIAGDSTINGELKPGNSPGLLTFSNSLTLGSNATTTMEITGTATRGVSYDAITVGSTLTYGGTLILDFSAPVYGEGNYTFNLFDFGSASGNFGSMSLAGIYSGSFTRTGDVWGYTQGDNTWSFNQADGVLNFTVVPEPNVAMVAGSLMLMGLLRRRRD